MRQERRTAFATVVLTTILLLAGCGSVLESDAEPDTTWWLTPTQFSAPSADPAEPLGLQVRVVPGLDTDWVLTLDPDARLNHFAGAHWPEHLPEFLGSLVARSLEASGRYRPVILRDHVHMGSCLLLLEVRRFWTRLDDARQARAVEVELAGRLECEGGTVTDQLFASASTPVAANRMPDIVAATQRGFDDVMVQLLEQLP
jgi:ABC-type uncharacterized transport system auxiliary subunit